jgi:hypothetical protein
VKFSLVDDLLAVQICGRFLFVDDLLAVQICVRVFLVVDFLVVQFSFLCYHCLLEGFLFGVICCYDWIIVVFFGVYYLWQNCPTIIFDRNQTLEV